MAALNQSAAPKTDQTDTGPTDANISRSEDVQVSNANPPQENANSQDSIAPNKPNTPPTQTANMDTAMTGTTFMDLPPLPPLQDISPPMVPPQMPLGPAIDLPYPNMTPIAPPQAAAREVGAFAKLNFDDGHYYMSTYQIELGRDAIAYNDAVRRADEEKHGLQMRAQSSSGPLSRHSDRIKHGVDSQIPGSVVSEAGGFAGLDDMPVIGSNEGANELPGHPSHSSQVSQSDIVKPGDIFAAQMYGFDYAKRERDVAALMEEPDDRMNDDEQPAPVTADHMPNPHICPLIPIHATIDSPLDELQTHKQISRRHARIQWNMDDECFKITVLGKNGLFVDGSWLGKHKARSLRNGAEIQIAGVVVRFELPHQPSPEVEETTTSYDRLEQTPERPGTNSPISNQDVKSETPQPKVTLKIQNKKSGPSAQSQPPPLLPELPLGPDGQPIVRKRGPGRPPKDGIMSTRERKEREKAAREAAAKAANGGITPPPMSKGKLLKPPTKEEIARTEAARLEKKNSQKRKREDGEVMPSIEGGQEDVPSDAEKQPIKKVRQSKSPSPTYPALNTLTEEQLARPPEAYARLIYDILIEIYPRALPLKQIYRAIKSKYPFFVHRVESDGWQSSVRHNLNQEYTKLFDKGEKEGKGFAWKAIPGALQPQAERKRAAQQAAASKPKPAQRQQNQPSGPVNWQNNSAPFQQPPYWTPNGQNQPPRPAGPNGGPAVVPANAAQRPPGAMPQPPTAHSAASNMPCSFDGLMAIRRFETFLFEGLGRDPNPVMLDALRAMVNSVKARLLHGHPQSTSPKGETTEEVAIMDQVKRLINEHRNPGFRGFRPQSRGSTPMTPASGPPPGLAQSHPPSGQQSHARPPPAMAQTQSQRTTPAALAPQNGATGVMPRQGSHPSQTAPPQQPQNVQQRPNIPVAGGQFPQQQPQQQHPSNLPPGQAQQAGPPMMQRPPSAGPHRDGAPRPPSQQGFPPQQQARHPQAQHQPQRPPSQPNVQRSNGNTQAPDVTGTSRAQQSHPQLQQQQQQQPQRPQQPQTVGSVAAGAAQTAQVNGMPPSQRPNGITGPTPVPTNTTPAQNLPGTVAPPSGAQNAQKATQPASSPGLATPQQPSDKPTQPQPLVQHSSEAQGSG